MYDRNQHSIESNYPPIKIFLKAKKKKNRVDTLQLFFKKKESLSHHTISFPNLLSPNIYSKENDIFPHNLTLIVTSKKFNTDNGITYIIHFQMSQEFKTLSRIMQCI